MRDVITGRKLKANPLNKSKLDLFELEEYMLGEEDE